jgi:hypothetical protein
VESVPGFSVVTTRACFHAGGKYCLRRTALNTSVRKVIALRQMSHGPLRYTVRAPILAKIVSLEGL